MHLKVSNLMKCYIPAAAISLLFILPVSHCFWASLRGASRDFPVRVIPASPVVVYNQSIIDGLLAIPQTTPDLLQKFGYPVEIHHTITEDDYVLELHRIPHGKSKKRGASPSRKSSILLMHGIASTSINWILNAASVALPYKLVDAGYDVWLGNFRGNTYSKRHLKLKSDSPQYWDFSWHEMGMYDIPAMIDHILATTQDRKLMYVGHSMGSTAFFVTMSMKPEYNDKIKAMFALAPVVFFHHIRSAAKIMTPLVVTEKLALETLGQGQFFPTYFLDTVKNFGASLCKPDASTAGICDHFIRHVAGTNPLQLNKTWIPLLFRNFPDTFSTRTVIHFAQQAKLERFCQYSYGDDDNIKIYGSSEPPSYNLSKVTAPVAIYWSEDDWLATPEDVHALVKQLPTVIQNYKVQSDSFSHLDFICAMDSGRLVYNKVLETIDKIFLDDS